MPNSPSFDVDAAHRHFSADCFNQTWTLLDKANSRTEDESRLMVAAAFASVYHWLQRPDVTPKNESVGYWQISRVMAVLERGPEALHYAELCLSKSGELPPFYRAYAFESIARSMTLLGQADRAQAAKAAALKLLPEITDTDERSMLEGDLRPI